MNKKKNCGCGCGCLEKARREPVLQEVQTIVPQQKKAEVKKKK